MGQNFSRVNNHFMNHNPSVDCNLIMGYTPSVDCNLIMGYTPSVDNNPTMDRKLSVDNNPTMGYNPSVGLNVYKNLSALFIFLFLMSGLQGVLSVMAPGVFQDVSLQARQLLPDATANETHTTDSGLDVYPMDVAVKKATAEGKKILMDVYAVWCPYCKKMHTEVYTDSLVQEVIGKYFYLVKINVEGSDEVLFRGQTYTETTFARALNVTSYPSTFFMDTGENILGMQPGVVPPETFAYLLSYVGTDEYLKRSFEEYLPEDVKKRMQAENQ
ncbi:MAG: hypothetical protein DA446_03580 [Bacteroidetes bacterium]|nr:MAG: hypothetical protein DA446_03580 [Bacteroidota bacterium]